MVLPLLLTLLLGLAACGSDANANEPRNNDDNVNNEEMEEAIEPVELQLTEFAEEIGLTLEEPLSEVETQFSFKGTVEKASELEEDFVWVNIWDKDNLDGVGNGEFEYYVPIENGTFDQDLTLPGGLGEYNITVRFPSLEDGDNYYYDAVTFDIENIDEEVIRDVEYQKYGVEKELQIADMVAGYNEAEQMIEVKGAVGSNYEDDLVLAEVNKDGEYQSLAFSVENGEFSGEIPLYYGQGIHEVKFQLFSDKEEDGEGMYYDAAVLYVDNTSDQRLTEISEYEPATDRGLLLEQPSVATATELSEIEYPVKGTIDTSAPNADTVSHVIVELQHEDDYDDKATYFFPVIDNKFDDIAHFRFGPGKYKVTVYVPEIDQDIGGMFQYTSAYSLEHEVTGIEDERDILPSRGVESDSEEIIKKAESLIKGLSTEREKAEAIYKFVATHVAYDVEKYELDIFHPDDSAIETLETGEGICQDYAFLALALLRSVDIESRYVQGFAGDRHAWVELKVDGDWIEMDPTWGAGYVDGDEFHFQYNEDYFDPDPDFLAETHDRTGVMY